MEHHGLLRVEPVLGLLQDDGPLAVEHAVRDLLAPVRRQAVHHERRGLGEADQGVVDLVAAERLRPPLVLGLLTHAGPHVGVDHVGAGRRGARVLGDVDPAAEPARRGDHARVGLVPRWARDDDRGAEQRTEEHHGVADIVAVADPREPQPAEVDAALPQREEIGQRLAGVLAIRQPVDHRDRRVPGERGDRRVGVDARHDAVDPQGQVAGDVGHRFTRAQADLAAVEMHGASAQLDEADLEGDASAERGLLEDQRARFPGQRLTAPLAGKTCALIFEKPSLRTRVTFEVGLIQLGGRAVHLDGREIGLGTRESVPDVARNLSLWVDGIMARVYSHSTITALARHATIPVINGLSDREHPCQALADFFTLWERGVDFGTMRLAWIGDGNNVCHSVMRLGALLGASIVVACPPGYEPNAGVQATARRLGGRLEVTEDARAAATGADVLYTDVWTSMGQEG